jgi:hypothetical protein
MYRYKYYRRVIFRLAHSESFVNGRQSAEKSALTFALSTFEYVHGFLIT